MLNMGNPFVNDPFSVVWSAFRELYPDINCEVVWSNEIEPENPDETAYGFTIRRAAEVPGFIHGEEAAQPPFLLCF